MPVCSETPGIMFKIHTRERPVLCGGEGPWLSSHSHEWVSNLSNILYADTETIIWFLSLNLWMWRNT